nr:hypothetical protein [Rhizobiaceae bacterium]
TFDENKKPLGKKGRFLLAAHRGRLNANLLAHEDGIIRLSGLILNDQNQADLSFADEAKFFRMFVGIRMNKSEVPLELISMEVQELN